MSADNGPGGIDHERAQAVATEPFLLAQAKPPSSISSPLVPTPAATKALWDDLVERIETIDPPDPSPARKVIGLLLRTRSGIGLVDDLHRVLSKKGNLRSRITLDFRPAPSIPHEDEEDTQPTTAGLFSPGRRYARRYRVYVGWAKSSASGGGSITFGSRVSGIFTTIESGLSMMTETLFHELLHIWYIHEFKDPERFGGDDEPDTGHTTFNDASRGYDFIAEVFRERLKALLVELEQLEAFVAAGRK